MAWTYLERVLDLRSRQLGDIRGISCGQSREEECRGSEGQNSPGHGTPGSHVLNGGMSRTRAAVEELVSAPVLGQFVTVTLLAGVPDRLNTWNQCPTNCPEELKLDIGLTRDQTVRQQSTTPLIQLFNYSTTLLYLPAVNPLTALLDSLDWHFTPMSPLMPSHIIIGGLPAGLVRSMSSRWISEHTALGEQVRSATTLPSSPDEVP